MKTPLLAAACLVSSSFSCLALWLAWPTSEPDAGGGSPRVLTWPTTAMPVRSLRLVLDTDRTPGWNEIDAVELLGPAGGQWATRATASSTFANQGEANVDAATLGGLRVQKPRRR